MTTERSYQDGDCQLLAAAIQRITGWDVAVVDGAGCHVVAVTPDGRYLDSAGLRTAADLAATYGAPAQWVGNVDDLGWLGTAPAERDYTAALAALAAAGLANDDHREMAAHHAREARELGL